MFNATAANHRAEGRASANQEQENTRRLNATMAAMQSNSPDDAMKVNHVKNLFYQAKAHRKPLVDRWNKSYKVMRGRQWDENLRPNYLPSPSVPEIFPIVRSTV